MIIKINDRIKLVFIVLVTVLFCFIFGIFGKSLFKLNKITILILISVSIISCIIWCIKVYRRKKGIIKEIEKIDILGRTLQFKNGVCLINNQIVKEVEMKDALDSFNKFFTSKNINGWKEILVIIYRYVDLQYNDLPAKDQVLLAAVVCFW